MMNVMFVALANSAFSNVIESVNLKHFSLAWSTPSLFSVIATIKL